MQATGVLALLAVILGTGWAVSQVEGADLARRELLGLFCLGFVLLLAFVTPRLADNEWFHPLAFPAVYAGIALLGPLAYIVGGDQVLLGIGDDDVSETLVLALGGCFAGLVGGCGLALAVTSSSDRAGSLAPVSYDGILKLGRLILVATILLRLPPAIQSIGQPYGTATSYTYAALDSASAVLLFVGVIFTALGCVHRHGRIATRVDVGLIAFYALITLSVGRRGEMIAPLIFLLWAYHVYVSRLGFRTTLVAIIVVLTVFQGVVGIRGQDGFYAGSSSFVERTLGSIGTSMQVTYLTAEKVPRDAPHRDGRTYWAAIQYQPPGVVADYLFGAPTQTGTFALRDILGQTDPNSGLSFSLPAEGFLNFGVTGSLLAGLLVGGLLGLAYRRQVHGALPSRATQMLYPIMIATLPLSLRSDALTQVKFVLYPMLALVVVFAVQRTASHMSQPRARDDSPGHRSPIPDYAPSPASTNGAPLVSSRRPVR